MFLSPLFQPTSKRPTIQFLQGGKSRAFIAFLKANFNLTTWLLVGAFLQSAIVFLTPGPYALLLPALLLFVKLADTVAMTVGLKHDPYMDESIMGRYSAQILDKDSNYPDKVGNEQVVVMMLGVRSNHALGMFAPGYKEVGDYFTQMVIDLEKHKTDKENGGGDNGFLGMSAWNSATDRSSGNEFMTISYWRSVDDIHRFAHAGIHSEAWKWWNKTVKQHPHVGIMHEIYSVPKQQWESIYVNYHPTQLAATSYPKKQKNGEVEWISPMVDANKAPFRTSAGRLGLNKGEKVSTEMGEIQY